jgi:putative oxygen-independent coproporphyrinogen III oxidase
MNRDDLGLYIHVPFCLRRCGYCDFFSTEGRRKLIPGYVQALRREIQAVGAAGEKPRAGSVFFGGGTPSLLAPRQMVDLMEEIRRAFRLEPDAEISLEANPGTVDYDRLAGYRAAGINRLSLGLQSADEGELRMLGRIHTFSEAVQACADVRRAGFTNLSLDLIYTLPAQNPASWERTIDRALSLAPEHLSLYALTLERGTKLARSVRRGELPAPDEDLAAEMYERAEEKLAAAGFRHYEISNWAKDGVPNLNSFNPAEFPLFACRHNLRYWLNLPYLGLGAGAHGCAAGRRYSNIRSVEKYMERMRSGGARRFPYSPAATNGRIRTREEEMRETMWLGLRLTEAGVNRERFQSRFGEDYCDRFAKEIESSVAEGLLEWVDSQKGIRLTARGRLLGNIVFARFVE